MTDQRPGEGGAANTPPFPRLVQDDDLEEVAENVERVPHRDAPSPLPGSSETLHSDPRPIRSSREALARAEMETARLRERAAAENRMETAPKMDGDNNASIERRHHHRRRGNPSFQLLADRIEEWSDRLNDISAVPLLGDGSSSRAGAAANGATGILDSTAEYLRNSDLRSMRADLEERVREKPIQTVLAAIGVGWFIGKLMR